MNKTLLWIFVSIGGSVGSYLPVLLGADFFSAWSIIGGAVGGLAGVWLALKIDI